ncbi:MAG: flagellin [Candidatus Zixiibacteriota bacterium]
MSLRINNNIAAIDSHRNLTNTTMSLTKSMEKLSSGYRINRAADDPAGLVISEQFRAQIAGLNQAIENSEGSVNMIQTAEGALNEINSLLVSMRELAIHAANEGFNDTAQLEADQAEINNAIHTIDRIAANTQFGTKKLLDGTKANVATITSSNSAGITLIESGLSTGTHSITATKTADATASLNITSFGVSLDSTITPYNLTEGIHNIDVIQASAGASKVSTAVNILDAWGNGLEFAAAATSAQLTSAAAIGAPATASNAGTYTVKLNYQENGQSVAGWQTLSVDVTDTMTTAQLATAWNDAINNNAALAGRVEAVMSAGNELVFRSVNAGANYSVAIEGVSTDATTAWYTFADGDARGASANEIRFDIDVAKSASSISATTTITAGTYTSLDTLITQLETDLAVSFGTAATGVNNIHVAKVNDNQIEFTLMDEGSDYSIQLLATTTDDVGAARAALGLSTDAVAVQGTDALISFDNYTNTVSAVNYNSTQSFTLANKAEDTAGRGTIGITIATANQGINLGSMLLDSTAARFDARLDAGPATAVTAGLDTYVYNADRTESLKVNIDLTSNGGSETISNTDQSLVFQIGANVGQIAKISLPGMAASSLGRNIAGNMFTSLAGIDVTTVQGAQDAQTVIDSAIDQVSTIRGTLGSFQKNTLESNLRNLRIASQNLQSSESTIRDTDMAAEMSVFVKNQILLQAGTAMLAQANQVPQVVLSLFQ